MSCRMCQNGFCIGVSWKDKACSPLSSVAFSKHQPPSLSLSPLCPPLPSLSLCFFSSFLFLCSNGLSNTFQNSHYKYSLWVYPLWHVHTPAHTHKTGHEKVAERGPDGGTICPGVVYQSARPQHSQPHHHNLVCLQHKVWSKLGWVH